MVIMVTMNEMMVSMVDDDNDCDDEIMVPDGIDPGLLRRTG